MVATAMRGPVATAIAMIAMVCKVIGTGQNGTVVLALAVITATPSTTIRQYFAPVITGLFNGADVACETGLTMMMTCSLRPQFKIIYKNESDLLITASLVLKINPKIHQTAKFGKIFNRVQLSC